MGSAHNALSVSSTTKHRKSAFQFKTNATLSTTQAPSALPASAGTSSSRGPANYNDYSTPAILYNLNQYSQNEPSKHLPAHPINTHTTIPHPRYPPNHVATIFAGLLYAACF